jgi:ATP-dependent helicase/nuclease subunit A
MSVILQRDSDLAFPANIVVGASAGSGKTYTLTQRYVQFLLSPSIQHNNTRNILAITFTNLAAKEMRQKVLDYLKALCLGDPKQVGEMSTLVSLDVPTLKKQACKCIDHILANYSDFQVKTIDSFMVSVFKASALDFGFNPDVEIQLTNDTLIDEAFAAFSREFVSRPGQAALLDHLVDMLSQTREGRKRFLWDPYKTIADEVKELYQLISSQPGRPVVEAGADEIRGIRQQIVQKASSLHSMLTSMALPIQKNLERDLLQSIDGDVDPVVGRTLKDKPVGKLVGPKMDRMYEQYRQEVEETLQQYNNSIKEYCLVRARSYYGPYLKAIEEVKDVLDGLKRRQGTLFIHDINKMLVDNLVQERVPEVYFRLGETIYHYMIDEFQDTAPIQWANLRPLIENSLAEGTGSLFVVGDTKQSIYGFRFADWTIMKRLKESNEFPSAHHEVNSLDTNWRSDEKIVAFTREVFEESVPLTDYAEPGRLSGLNECGQQVSGTHLGRGYVEVCFFGRDEEFSPEKGKIISIIGECRGRGYQLRDIALLTPNNEDVIKVSGWLNEQGIPFISHSSLDIRTRKITGELIALLQFLDSPVDDLSFASFLLSDLFEATLQHHRRNLTRKQISEFLFSAKQEGQAPLYKVFLALHPRVWELYFEDLFTRVGYLPLYDLVSELYKVLDVFSVMPQQEGTLVKLLEVVKLFEEGGNSSIKDFLSFALDTPDGSGWEMEVPVEGDAVTLMTIHKAKGLDFPVVLVLLYDWRNPGRPYTVEEFEDGIRILHISEKDAEKVDSLADLYNGQKVRNQTDDLNKLYVALTRAEEEMYVLSVFDPGKEDKKGERKGKEDRVPSKFLPNRVRESMTKPFVGKRPAKERKSLETFHHTIRRRYEAGGLRKFGLPEMARGDAVHAVLAQIEILDGDIDAVVDRAIRKAGLDQTQAVARDEICATVTGFLNDARVQAFFSPLPERRVLRETELANASGMVYRLDRVLIDKDSAIVVDFKTGGFELEGEYRKQAENYISLLKDVFPAKKITGVLAYVDRREVRHVA